jgi:formylglycine-generating enzyme required for sulfatase activity
VPVHQPIDITDLAVLGEQFPIRLMQLGFRLMQVIDEQGRDVYRYVIPPVCEVPAGRFRMGSFKRLDPQAEDEEWPQQKIYLPTFRISTYPLTVSEYACFAKVMPVNKPNARRVSWQEQIGERGDHPVVGIGWRDAQAYTRWLSQATGDNWRLPTEAEWEKASRGTSGRIYPWGNEWDPYKANIAGTGPGDTTPVGAYADQGDASPYGVHDLAGNVCEWTFDFHEDARKDFWNRPCTLRGGSWASSAKHARAAHRGGSGAAGEDDVGARLVCEKTAS